MPSTSSHTRITLNAKGLKRVNTHGHGNHYVNLKIVVPPKLSAKQRALIQAYAELETDTPGQILGVTNKTDGGKQSTTEPVNLTEAVREALNNATAAAESKKTPVADKNEPIPDKSADAATKPDEKGTDKITEDATDKHTEEATEKTSEEKRDKI